MEFLKKIISHFQKPESSLPNVPNEPSPDNNGVAVIDLMNILQNDVDNHAIEGISSVEVAKINEEHDVDMNLDDLYDNFGSEELFNEDTIFKANLFLEEYNNQIPDANTFHLKEIYKKNPTFNDLEEGYSDIAEKCVFDNYKCDNTIVKNVSYHDFMPNDTKLTISAETAYRAASDINENKEVQNAEECVNLDEFNEVFDSFSAYHKKHNTVEIESQLNAGVHTNIDTNHNESIDSIEISEISTYETLIPALPIDLYLNNSVSEHNHCNKCNNACLITNNKSNIDNNIESHRTVENDETQIQHIKINIKPMMVDQDLTMFNFECNNISPNRKQENKSNVLTVFSNNFEEHNDVAFENQLNTGDSLVDNTIHINDNESIDSINTSEIKTYVRMTSVPPILSLANTVSEHKYDLNEYNDVELKITKNNSNNYDNVESKIIENAERKFHYTVSNIKPIIVDKDITFEEYIANETVECNDVSGNLVSHLDTENKTSVISVSSYDETPDLNKVNISEVISINSTVNEEEYESDACSGYHSSDFEFISESEAKSDGFIINYTTRKLRSPGKGNNNVNTVEIAEISSSSQKTINCSRPHGSTTFTDEYNRLRYDNVLTNRVESRHHHKIPEGDDYLKLFQNIYPSGADLFLLENKSVRVMNCINMRYHGIGFDMRKHISENSDGEYKEEAEETTKKILAMYPTENRKRRRRF